MKYGLVILDGFDWDIGNTAKIGSRVPIKLIEEFFCQKVLLKEDPRHSRDEVRYIAMGFTENPKRCLVVAFTIRKKGARFLLRPISARFTHKKEEMAYEEQIEKLKKEQRIGLK